MEILNKKEQRKYEYILRNVRPSEFETLKAQIAYSKDEKNRYLSKSFRTELESIELLLSFFDRLGLSEKEAYKLWWNSYFNGKGEREIYKLTPVRERKDNKDVLNTRRGSGGYRGNTIRFPKKVRGKATWKKFYKLFPHLLEKKDGK